MRLSCLVFLLVPSLAFCDLRGLARKHDARDPWPAIQGLRAQTSADLEDRLKGGAIYFAGTVEDLFTDGIDKYALLRCTSKAASIDFELRVRAEVFGELQKANQETGADTFGVIANISKVSRMSADGRFLAKGVMVGFEIEPRRKSQVPNEGSEGFTPQ